MNEPTADSTARMKTGSEAQTVPSVAVRIAGHEYKIRTESDPAQIREVAGYVDRAMSRVRERTRTVDTLDVAVLTCLNLARDLLALNAERGPSRAGSVDAGQLQGLIERVEAALGKSSEAPKPEASANISAEGKTAAAEAPTDSTPRTLDLPSVESLRERSASSTVSGSGLNSGDDASEEPMPEARVASGGRDRAS